MKKEKLGVQLFTVRDFMNTEKEIAETFKKLKILGYDQAQTAGCSVDYEIFGKLAEEAGIEIVGTHDDYDMMCNDFDKALANHNALGTKIMGLGGCGDRTVSGYADFIKNANIIGEKLKKTTGGRYSYHNHHWEFIKLENGKTAMEMLMEGLNPDTTSFCLDTHWVQRAGADVREWIEKLSGRIDIIHLKDFKLHSDGTPDYAELGQGNMNWEGILECAAKAGVKYYVVEQDVCPGDPFESLKISSEYMHKNFM